MTFIRKRRTTTWKGKDYFSHQLIETYRDGGKVKQRILANFGAWSTAAEALDGWQRHLAWKELLLRESEAHLAKAAEWVEWARENRSYRSRLFKDIKLSV